uniref:Uncharacterized protein LOC114330016 isoform X1 n=1 Tax=Diabrotica virgifera virgifera TaxID=50390 RepID=A0A6P7FJD5_DIAVI
MDLNYVLQTILKILISTPGIFLICGCIPTGSYGAALLSSNNEPNRNLTNISSPYYDYEFSDSQELEDEEEEPVHSRENKPLSEEIPDPSPLVLPGYNLPENIFNHGKPFYAEKDSLTGKIDFQQKSPDAKNDDDLYDYVDEPNNSNIYDKANIDRKDGSLSSHRPSDVNQLIPNFHDFLNLPVKYNSAKYVYPLISSSYASTKYQGSVNKFHNHKDYPNKMTTKKPLVSPTYYSTEKYFRVTYTTTTPTTTTTRTTTTTTQKPQETTKSINLLNTGMGVGFSEEFEDYYDTTVDVTTKKPSTTTTKRWTPSTTEFRKVVHTTNRPTSTTTKKMLSLFEQLFGEYDDDLSATTSTTSTTTTKPTEKIKTQKTTTKPSTTSTTTTTTTTMKTYISNPPRTHVYSTEPEFNYEYEDIGDNIAVESKPVVTIEDDLKVQPLHKNTSDKPSDVTTVKNVKSTDYYDYPDETPTVTTTTKKPFVTPPSTNKVTSLPLGENHLTTSGYEPFKHRDPIIVATQNLREKLNSEKVIPRPFEKPSIPSQNNVHIPHDQNSVSFVLGNQQNVNGVYYDSNPFRPYYGNDVKLDSDEKEITLQGTLSFPSETVGSAVTIQPQRNSEASLAIGVPVNGINKQTPGQVLDEKLELDNPLISLQDSTKTLTSKVVFPNDKQPEYPDFMPPPPPSRQPATPNREILQLNSGPILHQLPSDLTPPREQEVMTPKRPYSRPPWDPRPGHFYSGNPEYNRPPRPQTDVAYKRIDHLPNVLPQFRPNTNMNKPPAGYFDKKLNRQPLLDRPSNRPISFFEKLLPPPPPPPLFLTNKNVPALRNKNGAPPRQNFDEHHNNPPEEKGSDDQPGLYQTPPQIKIANRRADTDVTEVETLQMIQAKNADKRNKDPPGVQPVVNIQPEKDIKIDSNDKTIYKVYPVNSAPIKLDVIDDSNKKESVVIGTRSERPLPPSKINQDFDLLFDSKDRNDDPILKPHKPPPFPVKSDFPYPLERPGLEPNLNVMPVPEAPSKNGNDLDEPDYFSNNQWNSIGDTYEPKIITGGQKITGINQISVTLKTHTDRPIAVAYTPTEPNSIADKYSMPNYGSPVIPEIRPGDSNKVFTVSAVMHAHHESPTGIVSSVDNIHRIDESSNHKNDLSVPDYPKLDFEAPFQASLNIENTMNQGWSVVVRNKNTTTTESPEATTLPYATTSEFDIENFKPQLEGGFKPIFNFPDEDKKFVETKVSDRDE